MKPWSIVAVSAALVAGCAAPASRLPPVATGQLSPYQLGPGDEIRVTVFGLDAATNSYIVGDAGTISMPLLDVVSAEGKTTREFEAEIATRLRDKAILRDPSVSVQVQKYRPFFILGQVQRPGQYAYVPGMSVLTAVSIAGGYTFRADTRQASITRPAGGRNVQGRAEQQTPVLPGDTVLVYESRF